MQLLRSASEIHEAETPFARLGTVEATAIVCDLEPTKAILHGDRHTCFGGMSMAPDVGQRLSDDGQKMFSEFIRCHGVDGTVEGDRDIESDYRGEVAHERDDAGS